MQGTTKLLRDIEHIAERNTPGGSVENKVDRFLRELAYNCAAYARDEYTVAAASGVDGADTITVPNPSIKGGTAVISAKGDQILFVEFGTGINDNYDSNSWVAGAYGFSPASWSVQNKKWLVPPRSIEYRGWWYTPDGRETQGHPPVDAMYHAFERVRSELPALEKAVFK